MVQGRSQGHFHPQKVFPVEVEAVSLLVPLTLALKFLEQRVLPVGDVFTDGNKLGARARSEAEERMAVVGGRRGCGRDGSAGDETKLPLSLTATGCVSTHHFSLNPAKFTGKGGFEPLTLHPQQDSFPPPLITLA